MNWTRWLPLRFIIRRTAQSQGFLDPIELMARLRSFAQPSEVGEPVELLRAGAIFHARGLINSKVIQHNLDWVWPYWIVRQYNPNDVSFLPRAFSISHINLTHRNWTAIGYPDCEELPLVDPRGMLTPFFDGWSVDCWLVTDDGQCLLPSHVSDSSQKQLMADGLSVHTCTQDKGLLLSSLASVILENGVPVCRLQVTGTSDAPASLVVALRPLNPEGISFINKVSLSDDRRTWTVDDKRTIEFSSPAASHHVSDYAGGDVFAHLMKWQKQFSQNPSSQESQRDVQHQSLTPSTSSQPGRQANEGSCNVGLLTAATVFPLDSSGKRQLTIRLPLLSEKAEPFKESAWETERSQVCELLCPDERFQMLYDAAVTSLILHSPHDVFPGPYTYKRFWFRDAAFIIHALLCVGMNERAARALLKFPSRQTSLGYFRSQEGEWDANGEVLWILHRYQLLTGRKLSPEWDGPILRGARWISRKRLPENVDSPHAGLLPPGFSAEHLGLNDYYYWDDFWGVAGLKSAAALLQERDPDGVRMCHKEAGQFADAIDKSLRGCAERLGRPAMPASPYRRLDAGAIGSLAIGYPLQACSPNDPRLLDCVDFLMKSCFVNGAFFQDMIHSGLNAYLTLQIAQVLLRAGDPRYLALMDTVAALATSTGQWPEAINPRSGGGCMGDGHHVWASAEWVLMIRNCFVREEDDLLILCAGVPERWLDGTCQTSFGPAPTEFGCVSIRITSHPSGEVQVFWEAEWRKTPRMEVRMAGFKRVSVPAYSSSVTLVREGALS
ncbi:MAG: hypothetical protein Q8L20_06625 [Gammaproteobacteria bacterium]|nr:hypothetical protein [Gammaproteobacteria bacterium]